MKIENNITRYNSIRTCSLKKSINPQLESLSFKGVNIHILDGAAHGGYIEHFAKAAFNRFPEAEAKILYHKVKTNTKIPSLKQMDSLEKVIKELNSSNVIKKGDYVSIPAIAMVGLLNLNERIKSVLGKNIMLLPNNIMQNKNILLAYLEKIYDKPDKYSQDIEYMDGNHLSLKSTYGVIKEINKLVKKGVKVYLPSGHPMDNSIKWKAKQENINEDLYRSIANPNAPKEEVTKIINQIKKDNWYDFNLLSLSNAKIVNVLGTDNQDFIFSAFDNCVNDSARGVYNFSPVRLTNGEMIGYSFFDETTNEYPYEEFPYNDKTKEITKFVGLPARDFIADESEIIRFKNLRRARGNFSQLPDKLYDIRRVFDQREIDAKKLNYLGNYTNNTHNFTFDTNKRDILLFQKLNYEGSEKPSVFSMWGSCFATINAIKRDVELSLKDEKNNKKSNLSKWIMIGASLAIGAKILLKTIIGGDSKNDKNQ